MRKGRGKAFQGLPGFVLHCLDMYYKVHVGKLVFMENEVRVRA